MKIHIFLIIIIIIGVILNFCDYNAFLIMLSMMWGITSFLIIYTSIKYSLHFKFRQFNIKEIIKGIKSKSKNNISPLNSLCISLAAKIGVGSLSGVALAIYFGGIGTIFWIIIISLIVSINTYVECLLGIKYREKVNGLLVGGPSFYIKKCLSNKKIALLYSFLIIVCYSGLFLSVQANTIVGVTNYLNINKIIVVFLLLVLTLITILNGIRGVSRVNTFLVPVMLVVYSFLGIYVFITNIDIIPSIFNSVIKAAFNIKSIFSVFLIGMQRAIFMTESSVGTSAISASSCDNEANKQGMLEVLGIYIIVFLVCLTTFIIIITSDYDLISFSNINGIEIVIYAFNYHFGYYGGLLLSIITILFAFSTITSSYYFGESNLLMISDNKLIAIIFKLFFLIIMFISCYVKANIIWNMTDFLVAILVIINLYAILKINDFE